MVDRLLVRCKACLQSNIQRGNFDEHFNKYCLKTYVSCSASDLKCPWQGPRDQFQIHLTVCQYEIMRPLLGHLLNTVNTLTEKVHQYENQSKIHENRINLLQNENDRLKDEVNLLKNQSAEQLMRLNHMSVNELERQRVCSTLNERMQLMQILSGKLLLFILSFENFFVLDPNVNHNPRLEQIISRYHSCSTIMLNDLRLNSFDIPFVIRKALIIKQCSVLNLSNNLIDTYGIELLANALRSNLILKRLCLKGNRAKLKGVDQLMNALIINNTLEVLELETNDIPDIAANSIANMLRHNRTLKDLYLGYNDIESRGMEIITNALDSTATLEILSIVGNKVDDVCIYALDKMIINNQKLRRLDLHENRISLEGKTRLLHIINAKKDFKLNL